MLSNNTRFCQLLLQKARDAAREKHVTVPNNMTALRMDKTWFLVEGDGMPHPYQVIADNAYHAKAQYIFSLIDALSTPYYW